MAEEFQARICGGNSWWSSSRHVLAASPCSVGFNDHMGGFGYPNDMVDIKATRSSCGEINNLVSDDHDGGDHSNSIANFDQYQDVQKPDHDSTLQMIGFGLSSSLSSTPSDFNQALLLRSGSGRGESNFHNSMLQEDMGMNTKLNTGALGDEESSSLINVFKPMNQDFSLDQLGSPSSSGFPISSSSSAANSYGFSSALMLQTLFDSEPVPQTQPQQSVFNNNQFSNGSLLSSSPTSNCWPPRYSPNSCLRPSALPKQLQPVVGGGSSLHFSNNISTPFWNAPAPAALNQDNTIRSSNDLFSSSQAQYTTPSLSPFHEKKPNSNNFTTKANTNGGVQDSSSSVVKKSSSSACEPVFKRARIETPSPLPTFKVRKEKLGDRITALQQLVSPFGKTDTASVLHEAIEYIKFLHDQVSVLSTPYMKNGAPMQQQQGTDKMEEASEGAQQDLQSLGLCLVPISSTFPVANETTADFWTPSFGATFR
ncbi:transcription factor bHLH112 isoform X1 [Pyrus x bretschneideri]|uniref:transcription factor bHLH112 isoform X1 n=1 Tax=Pyrus x bretschneideri TaxID=225117 RepID=UPI000510FEA9|nr:transcription factor bHLH112 isoform X1 [Pyrus x bretschneideri]